MTTDTITAISTSLTNSGIGIIRISGDDAFAIIRKIMRNQSGQPCLNKINSHTVKYGFIYDGETPIDEVLVLFLEAPHTYTRENIVEIDCHGGVFVMQKVLETVLKNGAKLAEPGEFTKRAFLNGRIDLSQAESVIDLINSENDFARKSSLEHLGGQIGIKIKDLRQQLIHQIAYIESALDDPEHISLDGYPHRLKSIVDDLLIDVDNLINKSEDGCLLKQGIETVIVGKPNVGKSSLLNYLTGEDRAIVTDIAGTTRDILKETIKLDDLTLNIIDTAGIRETNDKVEMIGVQKSQQYMEQADLIIYIVDASTSIDENDLGIIKKLQNRHVIVLLNKMDLKIATNKVQIEDYLDVPIIECSILEETGIQQLREKVKEMFLSGEIDYNDQIYITNLRQQSALKETEKSLQLVNQSIENQMPEDFYSIDLMNAYESLGQITGETVGEDLVNEIFSKFCMGK